MKDQPISRDTILSSKEDEDKSGPYLKTVLQVERTEYRINPEFPDDAKCDCGHTYYRHFDGYENNAPGCKYCHCALWHAPMQKAGLIPYIFGKDGQIRMMFMISSDPYYGGPLPQIAKGYIDPTDEGSKAGAIREAQEELGFKLENVKYGEHEVYEVYKGIIKGDGEDATFALYAVEVLNREDFNEPHFETKEVVWMSPAEYQVYGREAHRELVLTAFKKIALYHKYKVEPADLDPNIDEWVEVENDN